MPTKARPEESSTCKPMILILGAAAAGLLFATELILLPDFLRSRVLVVGEWVDLPQQETLVLNVALVLLILIILLPLLHALCIRWYTLVLR